MKKFVYLSLVFLFISCGSKAQTTSKKIASNNTASKNIVGINLDYTISDKTYEGYYVKGSKGLVFIMHDWDGLTDYEKKRSHMLGKLGYNVFALDLFGKGVRPKEIKDRREHTGQLFRDRELLRSLINGGIEVARAEIAKPLDEVAMGYCFGGAAVLELARSGEDLKGFVSFHGGLATPEGQHYLEAKGKYLIFHGTADSIISMGQFSLLANALESSELWHEMISYGGAEHAFTVFGGNRYDERADKSSWKRFVEFLANNIKK